MSADAFHDHLDTCAQCREHPFNLCPVGADLITKAAGGLPTGRAPSEPDFQHLTPRTDLGKSLRESFMRMYPMCPAVEKLDQPCPACEAGVPVTKKAALNTTDGRVLMMTNYSALEMRVMAQLNERADKDALVCADCGCEKGLVFSAPCPECRGRRVVYIWAIENIFGPNWRAAFK